MGQKPKRAGPQPVRVPRSLPMPRYDYQPQDHRSFKARFRTAQEREAGKDDAAPVPQLSNLLLSY